MAAPAGASSPTGTIGAPPHRGATGSDGAFTTTTSVASTALLSRAPAFRSNDPIPSSFDSSTTSAAPDPRTQTVRTSVRLGYGHGLDGHDPARRSRRVLRIGRAAARPDSARQAHRRR